MHGPLTKERIDELIEEGLFAGNPYEIVRRIEEEKGVMLTRPLSPNDIASGFSNSPYVGLNVPLLIFESGVRYAESKHGIGETVPEGAVSGDRSLLHAATKFELLQGVTVERTTKSAPHKWAVRHHGNCWDSIAGDWVDEPIPSDRSEIFLRRCRYSDLASAIADASSAAVNLAEEHQKLYEGLDPQPQSPQPR